MKKSLLFFVSAAALFLSGCEDGLRPSNDNGIKFSASKLITKTVYDENDDLQINWVSGDQVKIYCLEAEDATEATYNVNPKETKNNGNLSLASGKPLQWGGDTGVHNFFSVYPASSSISVENGVAICKVNTNQVCTVRNSGDANMIADPDMNNAYMVANLSTEPVDKVELHYRPIMTTLKITVRAKTEANQELAAVTGVSIISKTKCYADNFSYDIVNNSIIEGSTTKTVTTFVGVQNGESAFVDLKQGQTLTLTAFIPPVDINAENPVQVRLHAQHSDNLVVTLGKVESTCVKAASKRSVTLPHIPSKEVSGNNWITPLDDNIYVSQLSIPGTHDAAAYSTTVGLGNTQKVSFKGQLEMGIRAFDMRAAYRTSTRSMWMYHGVTVTDISLDGALSIIKDFLFENSGEFVFLQFRHESESTLGKDSNRWGDPMYSLLNNSYRDMIVPFSKDLTIGECRGKMIVVTRNDISNSSSLGVGVITNYANNDTREATINGDTKYIVQDYYNHSGGAAKIAAVKSLLERSASFNIDLANKNTWVLNHTSGYSGGVGTTLFYQLNARDVNPEIFRYLTGKEKTVGPTGIMFLDWVGQRHADSGISGWFGGTDVYGDLLPQAIIDNNYKYHMLRKEE